MLPPDARYLPDYVDEAAATKLLSFIDASPWRGDLKRRVQHYGYRYDYKARRVTNDCYLGPLPDWLVPFTERLCNDGIFGARPDQVIVNEYLPGQGIASHVDCEPCFGAIIASLSLGSTCLMEFSHVHSQQSFSHALGPRSLLVLHDEARFNWTHGIPARKSDVMGGTKVARGRRVSLTFRTMTVE